MIAGILQRLLQHLSLFQGRFMVGCLHLAIRPSNSSVACHSNLLSRIVHAQNWDGVSCFFLQKLLVSMCAQLPLCSFVGTFFLPCAVMQAHILSSTLERSQVESKKLIRNALSLSRFERGSFEKDDSSPSSGLHLGMDVAQQGSMPCWFVHLCRTIPIRVSPNSPPPTFAVLSGCISQCHQQHQLPE